MIRQVQSLNPDNLAAWRALDIGIMRGESRITRRQREMIATVVSATNQCSYWMTAHGEALRAESQDDQLVEGVKGDYTRLALSAAERAMLDYAVKLTVMPSSASEEDIKTLRAHDFDDRDILDIIYVICLYNFNDRMADATGISGHDFLYG
jgi:uncharacterized peroxidase-related enzyme